MLLTLLFLLIAPSFICSLSWGFRLWWQLCMEANTMDGGRYAGIGFLRRMLGICWSMMPLLGLWISTALPGLGLLSLRPGTPAGSSGLWWRVPGMLALVSFWYWFSRGCFLRLESALMCSRCALDNRNPLEWLAARQAELLWRNLRLLQNPARPPCPHLPPPLPVSLRPTRHLNLRLTLRRPRNLRLALRLLPAVIRNLRLRLRLRLRLLPAPARAVVEQRLRRNHLRRQLRQLWRALAPEPFLRLSVSIGMAPTLRFWAVCHSVMLRWSASLAMPWSALALWISRLSRLCFHGTWARSLLPSPGVDLPGRSPLNRLHLKQLPRCLLLELLKWWKIPLTLVDILHQADPTQLSVGTNIFYYSLTNKLVAATTSWIVLSNFSHTAVVHQGEARLLRRKDLSPELQVLSRGNPSDPMSPSWMTKSSRPLMRLLPSQTATSIEPFSAQGRHGVYMSVGTEVVILPWLVPLPPKLRLYLLGLISNPPNLARITQTILASIPLSARPQVPEAAYLECAQLFVAYLRGVRSPMVDSPEVIAQPQAWLAPDPRSTPQDPRARLEVGADLTRRPFSY